MRSFIICCSLLASVFGFGQELKAPDTVAAGALIEIQWTAGNAKDFVTIVASNAPEGRYGKYKYAKAGSWKAPAPEKAGDYEIRYLEAQSPYKTLARKPLRVTPVTASLKVPDSVDAGAMIPISWTGPGNSKDFITIVKKGTPERKYGKYVYVRKGNPIDLKSPEEPGDYEVRYLTGAKYYTLASVPIRVVGVSATLNTVDAVDAGSPFDVAWTGPNNHQDFITIVEADAPRKDYGKYVYTRKGSPLTLPAPDKPGNYEVRYLTGGKRYILAAVPIKVGAANATVSTPAEVKAGSPVSIEWTGPANPRDYVTIVKAGAKEGSYGSYAYVRKTSPLELNAPDRPGSYEVRYVTGAKGYTLASESMTVLDVSATLEAPGKVAGGDWVDVKWTGPGNPRDFIAFSPAGSSLRDWKSYRYTRRGNPLAVQAPMEPGNYELRYHTGREYRILATRAIEVSPPEIMPGRIVVVEGTSEKAALWSGGAVELILDASGSMLKRLDGKRRIDIALEVLKDLVDNRLSEGTPFALRVFGHKEADSCRTDLVQPLKPLNKTEALKRLGQITAMNKAKTPIAHSLELVASDLAGVSGRRTVVLITDGEETCGGDPAAAIEVLKAKGVDLQVNIVGFAIDDTNLKQAFRLWADLGDGGYFDAGSAGQLQASMAEALQTSYQLVDGSGNVVADGLVGGEPVEVPAGVYRVETQEAQPRVVNQVRIPSGELKQVTLENR